MPTLGQIEEQFNVAVFDHLAREADVPVVTKIAAQGDVLVRRVDGPAATTPIPVSGYPVVRGEANSNTHSLHAAPGTGVCFTPADDTGRDGLFLGTLTVPDGAEAYLLHPEHGGMAIAPGTYRIGRQREWAGEWRMVAD